MKKLLCAWIALALLLSAACGLGESLFVDNRETDKIYPERLNLRAQPAKNGAILGLYYTGTEVNVLAVENEEYDKVEVGGVTGYMASAKRRTTRARRWRRLIQTARSACSVFWMRGHTSGRRRTTGESSATCRWMC